MLKYLPFYFLILLVGCSKSSEESEQEEANSDKVKVAAVNYPLAYFAKSIGGENVEIVYPVAANEDPAFWTPSPEEVSQYQSSDIILLNGADYAKWVGKVSLPWSAIVNTTYEVRDEYIDVNEGITHSHGPGGEHEHAGYAFTTWLDMNIASEQAKAVYDALLKKLPENKSELESNYQTLINALEKLNVQIKQSFVPGTVYYGSHPVYQYLARSADVQIYSVHWEPGEDISEDQWQELEEIIQEHESEIMLWEGEPSETVKQKLIERDIRSVIFETGSNTPENGDFLTVMERNLENLKP